MFLRRDEDTAVDGLPAGGALGHDGLVLGHGAHLAVLQHLESRKNRGRHAALHERLELRRIGGQLAIVGNGVARERRMQQTRQRVPGRVVELAERFPNLLFRVEFPLFRRGEPVSVGEHFELRDVQVGAPGGELLQAADAREPRFDGSLRCGIRVEVYAGQPVQIVARFLQTACRRILFAAEFACVYVGLQYTPGLFGERREFVPLAEEHGGFANHHAERGCHRRCGP